MASTGMGNLALRLGCQTDTFAAIAPQIIPSTTYGPRTRAFEAPTTRITPISSRLE